MNHHVVNSFLPSPLPCRLLPSSQAGSLPPRSSCRHAYRPSSSLLRGFGTAGLSLTLSGRGSKLGRDDKFCFYEVLMVVTPTLLTCTTARTSSPHTTHSLRTLVVFLLLPKRPPFCTHHPGQLGLLHSKSSFSPFQTHAPLH